MIQKKLVIFIILMLVIPFTLALQIGTEGNIGIDLIPAIPTNYSTINVNNSDFWDGLDTPADITYDEISAGDVNALGYTGTFNFIEGVVGHLDMSGDPWWLGGTDLELAQELRVDGYAYLNDTYPLTTLTHSLGSGALRWLELYVANISAEYIDAFGMKLSENLTVAGFINGINISELDTSFLNLSGTNANQNLNVSPYNLTAGDMIIPSMTGNNGAYTVNHWFSDMTSAGRLIGGDITNPSGTLIVVEAGEGLIRDLDDDHSQVRSYMWDESGSINVPINSIMYFGVDLNGGTPIIVNNTDGIWDLDTNFPLGQVINQDGEIYIMNNPWWVGDGLTNIIERFQSQGWLVRDENLGGLILGYTGTRNPTMSAGTLWSRLTEHEIPEFTAPGDTFDYYYRDGAGGYDKLSDQTQWNITTWDDGGVLTSIGNNQYAVIWVWANVANKEIALTFPQATYVSSANAEAEEIPSTFPATWYKGGIIIGRILIKEGVDAPVEVQNVFGQTFTAAQAADHGNLAGLEDDDHPQYLRTDGTRGLTGNWDIGDYGISGNYFYGFKKSTGELPIIFTTDVENLTDAMIGTHYQSQMEAGVISLYDYVGGASTIDWEFDLKNNAPNLKLYPSTGDGIFEIGANVNMSDNILTAQKIIGVGDGGLTNRGIETQSANAYIDGDITATGNYEVGDFIKLNNQVDESAGFKWFTGTSGNNLLIFYEGIIYPEQEAIGVPDIDLGREGDEFNDLWLKGNAFIGDAQINDSIFTTPGNIIANTLNGTHIGDGSQLTGIAGGLWTNVSGAATYEDDVNITGEAYINDGVKINSTGLYFY